MKFLQGFAGILKNDINFPSGGGKRISRDLFVPYLGSIPIDPQVCDDSDNGLTFMAEKPDLPTAKAFAEIVTKIKQFLENKTIAGEEAQ